MVVRLQNIVAGCMSLVFLGKYVVLIPTMNQLQAWHDAA